MPQGFRSLTVDFICLMTVPVPVDSWLRPKNWQSERVPLFQISVCDCHPCEKSLFRKVKVCAKKRFISENFAHTKKKYFSPLLWAMMNESLLYSTIQIYLKVSAVPSTAWWSSSSWPVGRRSPASPRASQPRPRPCRGGTCSWRGPSSPP